MKNSEKTAFPLDGMHTGHPDTLGLTKREYFAGLAMQGLLANQRLSATEEELAKASIKIGGELLKQLEK